MRILILDSFYVFCQPSALSAYAHSKVRLVAEGDIIGPKQQIARMGATDSKSVMLYFEIRRNGKAVNPKSYLPSGV